MTEGYRQIETSRIIIIITIIINETATATENDLFIFFKCEKQLERKGKKKMKE